MDKLAYGLFDVLSDAGAFRDLAVPFQRYQGTTELAFAPDFEVKETKDAVVLNADLPGLKTEDLDISVHGAQLTITGKRAREATKEGERYHLFERSYGKFSRVFTLPETVDTKNLSADLKDGVLTLTLPKVPEAQPQKIAINAK